jgi:hypothetical protein
LQEVIGSARGHSLQSQSPAIPGKGRCPHLNAGAIGQLELNAFTLEGLLRRELHDGFQIAGGCNRRWRGGCRGHLASWRAIINLIRLIGDLAVPALGPAVAKQFGEVVLEIGKAPGEGITLAAGRCTRGYISIGSLPGLPFKRV